MFTYAPYLTAFALTVLCMAGFVAGIVVSRRVGPRAVVGAVACFVYALAVAPFWVSRFVSLGEVKFLTFAMSWALAPVLQFVALVLFIVAAMSRFRRAPQHGAE